jgi:NAD(P)-dependent dehydrogenase (short-subunit alcohol dehydrogenase family)
MDLRATSVVITGGSRGLGAALGRELACRRARVVLVARGSQDLRAVVEGIRAEGGEAYALTADITAADAPHTIAGAASALVGPPDILVHNASTLGPTPLPRLLDTSPDDLEAVIAANLVAPFRLTKAIAGSMAVRGRGLVVHVTSDAAIVPYPGWGVYGASKAALDQLGRVFAEELKETGVRFLSIDPGEMDTVMHQAAIPGADRSTLAKPEEVALRIVSILSSAEEIPTGSRIEASAWRPAA